MGNVKDQDGNVLVGVVLPINKTDGTPVTSDENGNFPGDIPNNTYEIDSVTYNGVEYSVATINVIINGGQFDIGTVIVNKRKQKQDSPCGVNDKYHSKNIEWKYRTTNTKPYQYPQNDTSEVV